MDNLNEDNLIGNAKEAVDILGNRWTFECMGCSIVNKDIKVPGEIIHEGKFTILAADPEIPIPGFLIINFKRHIYSFSETTKEEREELSNILYYAERALKDLNVTNQITLVQEERSNHFHLWIFSHHEWMEEKFGKGISYLRDISAYAKENADDKTVEEVIEVVKKVRDYFKENYKND